MNAVTATPTTTSTTATRTPPAMGAAAPAPTTASTTTMRTTTAMAAAAAAPPPTASPQPPHRRLRLAALARHLAPPSAAAAVPRHCSAEREEPGAEIVPFADGLAFGATVTGLDVRACLRAGWAQGHADGGAEYLNAMVAAHGLLLFRDQLPRLDAEELIAFSKWFGSGVLHSAHAQHEASEHFDIFRVANDPVVGCWEPKGVGTGGFHNDGAFMPAPYSNAVYQIVQVPRSGGQTHFASVNHCLGAYASRGRESAARVAELEKIRTVSELTGLEFPLAYQHPLTRKLTLLSAGWKDASRCTYAGQRLVSKTALTDDENRQLRRDVQEIMTIESGRYVHNWQPGDIVVSDNLAVMHKADETAAGPGLDNRFPDGSLPAEDIRILHRATIAGTHVIGDGTLTKEQEMGLNSLLSS